MSVVFTQDIDNNTKYSILQRSAPLTNITRLENKNKASFLKTSSREAQNTDYSASEKEISSWRHLLNFPS